METAAAVGGSAGDPCRAADPDQAGRDGVPGGVGVADVRGAADVRESPVVREQADVREADVRGAADSGFTGPGEQAERLARLLVRAQSGEREALHAIVAELTPLLWNVARGQGVFHADAEDVVQSVWLSLVARLAHIDTPIALVGWLVTACRRESWRSRSARDRARALEPERVAELAELNGAAEPAEQGEERVLADERLRVVRSALDRLSPRCAELLRMLAQVERPDYMVIAGALGMPRGSIGPTRGRCLAKLRALLQADSGWSAVYP